MALWVFWKKVKAKLDWARMESSGGAQSHEAGTKESSYIAAHAPFYV